MPTLLFLLVLCLATAHSQLTPEVQALVDLMASMRDTTADPCSDFYQYACGTFVANNPVPANITGPYLSVPAIDGIGYTNDALLAKIVNDPWPIVSDLYQACMQPTAQTLDELKSFFVQKVKQIEGIDVTSNAALYELLAWLTNHNVYAFIFPQSYVNDEQKPVLRLATYGNSMNAAYYKNSTLYNTLLAEIAGVFSLFESPEQAQQDAAAVIVIEEFIASYNNGSYGINVTANQLSEASGADFVSILSNMGVFDVDENTPVWVISLDYFKGISSLAGTYSPIIQVLQRYLQWQVYSTYTSWYQPDCWDNPSPPGICFAILGNSPYSPPWDQTSVCRNFVHIFDLVGLIFTYEVVSSDVSGSIKNMTTGIQQAFNKSLPTLDWLDNYSLESVRFKLANVLQIIGHPNVMDRYQPMYENVTTSPTSFFTNVWNILRAALPYSITQNTGPFNRSDFEFDPMVVNAFYDPNTNTINFPAGMLEGPMFSGSWPKLFQYSRMGVVVGHENTHGFDNQGSYWDAYGLPGDILDSATRTNFLNSAVCIADFYSQYVVYGNTTIPGNNTLGENIADIGGVKNSFRAYQAFVAQNGAEFKDYQLLPDLTTDQVYFLHYGQTWCSVSNVAWLEYQLQNDVHSPAKFRVNGPLTQFDEFGLAFNCPANKPMNPPQRCDLW